MNGQMCSLYRSVSKGIQCFQQTKLWNKILMSLDGILNLYQIDDVGSWFMLFEILQSTFHYVYAGIMTSKILRALQTLFAKLNKICF